jgi:uncharacterized membrane protein
MKKDAYSPLLRYQKMNVGTTERIISAFGGGFLLIDSLVRRTINPLEALVGSYMLFRGAAGYCPLHSALESNAAHEHSDNINIKVDLAVKRPAQELYEFWRNLANLPLFMSHIRSVTEIDRTTSVWKATGPSGVGQLNWKAEIVKDEPGRLLGWRTLPGAPIVNAGKVEFQELGNGYTRLHVVISYKAPLGVPGKELSRLLNPMFRDMVMRDVLNFKDYVEMRQMSLN